jgi:hypothetical protein
MIGLDLVECKPTWCGVFSVAGTVTSCTTVVHFLEPEILPSTGITHFLIGTANPTATRLRPSAL